MPANIGLDKLHTVLQAAMGWTNSHLHGFETPGGERAFADYSAEEGEKGDVEDERGIRLDELLKNPGDGLGYFYDLDDDWVHAVLLRRC